MPIVTGSAIKAIEGDQSEIGVPAIHETAGVGGQLCADAGAGHR